MRKTITAGADGSFNFRTTARSWRPSAIAGGKARRVLATELKGFHGHTDRNHQRPHCRLTSDPGKALGQPWKTRSAPG